MNGRPIGVALVVVALAAVMVVPALSGLRSTGTAVPVDLPVPPAAGDCAVRLTGPTSPGPGAPELPVSALRFGSCGGDIAGEIVAFWPSDEQLSAAPRSRRAGPCARPLAEFAGLDGTGMPAFPPAASAADPVSWRATMWYQAYLVIPSKLERRAGRDWSACLITPGSGDPYRGSLQGSFRDGALPTGFGSCWTPDGSVLLSGPGSCGRPHAGQLIATWWSGDDDSAADVTGSCTRLAAHLMATDDPTRGGQLQVVADRMVRLTESWTGNPSAYGCFVTTTGQRRLTGMVLGLGDRPIPFVS